MDASDTPQPEAEVGGLREAGQDDQREATELHRYVDGHHGDNERVAPTPAPNGVLREQTERITHPIKSFWRQQISATVPHDKCRDHLGMYRSGHICSIASGPAKLVQSGLLVSCK